MKLSISWKTATISQWIDLLTVMAFHTQDWFESCNILPAPLLFLNFILITHYRLFLSPSGSFSPRAFFAKHSDCFYFLGNLCHPSQPSDFLLHPHNVRKPMYRSLISQLYLIIQVTLSSWFKNLIQDFGMVFLLLGFYFKFKKINSILFWH